MRKTQRRDEQHSTPLTKRLPNYLHELNHCLQENAREAENRTDTQANARLLAPRLRRDADPAHLPRQEGV
jgi:hypothetical protein